MREDLNNLMRDDFNILNQLRIIRVNQVFMIRMIARVLHKEDTMAATLQDVLDKGNAVLQKATDAATLTAAIKVVVDGQAQTIKDLQASLDAAIATGDMTKVQAISDMMDAISAAQDSDAAAKAVLAGTPAGTGDL